MRRNMGRRVNNMGNPGGGPLMTGHLKDIDLELELLKRKREMIEQQQQLLVMEQQFKSSRHSFDPMRYDEPQQHGSNRDFTHMYEPAPKQRNQFGRKRQAEPQWQYDVAPKRSTPKKNNNPQSQFNQYGKGNAGPARNQRPGPSPSQGSMFRAKGPAPLMDLNVKQSIGQKAPTRKKSRPQKPYNKDFTANKVTNQKASSAPSKPAPQPERRTVSAASKSVSDADVARMLLPDRVPTQQVSGRLELALGAIMKNIRVLIDKHHDLQQSSMLRSSQLQRVMKQAVRERIRTVMLGKIVGSLMEILAVYREEFPEETDIDIVNIALEAGGVPLAPPESQEKSKFIESDNPGDFYRMNMTCLIETKLNEMFSKLEDIYGEMSEGQTGNAEVVNDGPKSAEDKNDPQESAESRNYPPESTEKEKTVEDANDQPNSADNTTDQPSTNNDKNNPPKSTKDKTELPKSDKEHISSEEFKKFKNSSIKVHDIKRFLPSLLKRYVPYLTKLMNVDGMYQTTKAAITMKANQMAAAIYHSKRPEEGQGDAGKTAPATTAATKTRQPYNLPYYVKILGHPALPKRKLMQQFLSQFNAKSIKKHRYMHNLLFVGFTDQNDFNIMVGADGTVIGRSTLSVRICSNKARDSTGGQNDGNNSTVDPAVTDDSNKNDEYDDSISSELDGQITELLTSIRKSEEEAENGEIIANDSNNKILDEAVQDNIIKQETDFSEDIEMKDLTTEKLKGQVVDKTETAEKPAEQEADKTETAEKPAEQEAGKTETAEKPVEQEAGKTETAEKPAEQEAGKTETAEKPAEQEADKTEAAQKVAEQNADKTETAAEVGSEDENQAQAVLDTQNTTEENATDTKKEVTNDTEKADCNESNNTETYSQGTSNGEKESAENPTTTVEQSDKLEELKGSATGRSTPSRTSARLANVTPSSIRTRRASRLAQN